MCITCMCVCMCVCVSITCIHCLRVPNVLAHDHCNCFLNPIPKSDAEWRTLDCQPPSSASIKTCPPKLPIVLTTRNTIQVKTLHAQSETNQNELETLHSVNFIESKIAVAFVTSLADALNNMRALSYSAMAGSVFMKNALRIP